MLEQTKCSLVCGIMISGGRQAVANVSELAKYRIANKGAVDAYNVHISVNVAHEITISYNKQQPS